MDLKDRSCIQVLLERLMAIVRLYLIADDATSILGRVSDGWEAEAPPR